jgi:hypothetical protein
MARFIKMSGSQVECYAIKGKTGLLVGLVTRQEDGRWKVELHMKWEHYEPTKDRAIAWAQGALAVIEQ